MPDGIMLDGIVDARVGVSTAQMWRELGGDAGNLTHQTMDAWRRRSSSQHQDIMDWMRHFRHDAIESLTAGDLSRLIADPDPTIRTDHPTADPRLPVGHPMYLIRDRELCVKATEKFNTGWALNHLFHRFLEEEGRIPRFEEYMQRLLGSWRHLYYRPMEREFEAAMTPWEIERGFRYRVGNNYYSNLREMDLLVRLRDVHGLPIRYHVLADVLLRVDLWCGKVLVAIYVPNNAYRDGSEGRKPTIDQKVDMTGFEQISVRQPKPTLLESGLCAPQSVKDVAEAARIIKEAMARTATN